MYPERRDRCAWSFRIVPHRFADDWKRDVLTMGYGSPTVTRHVGGQRNCQSQLFAQLPQLVVDQMSRILVLPSCIYFHVPDNRQQIGSACDVVFVDDVLHGLLPFNGELLPGFLSAIGEYSVLKVFFLRNAMSMNDIPRV